MRARELAYWQAYVEKVAGICGLDPQRVTVLHEPKLDCKAKCYMVSDHHDWEISIGPIFLAATPQKQRTIIAHEFGHRIIGETLGDVERAQQRMNAAKEGSGDQWHEVFEHHEERAVNLLEPLLAQLLPMPRRGR